MIKEILIALVAVVVVILIIAFAALRFLRADDSDTFDDLPDEPRKPGRVLADSGPMPAPVQRQRPMRPEPAQNDQTRALPRAPERTSGERAPGVFRDRDSQSRPASAERLAPGTSQRVPVPAARISRPARQPEADTQVAASWEAMSDVDYWTELAADKPLTAAAAGAAPTAPRRAPDAKPDRLPDSRAASRGDQPAALPVRQRTHPRGSDPASQSIAALARLGAQPPAAAQPTATGPRPPLRPDQPRPDQPRPERPGTGQPRTGPRPVIARAPQAPPAASVSYPGAQGRLPLPLDDDPLTSPSFPAINTADSRSYRTRRPGSRQVGSQQASGPDRGSAGFSPSATSSQQFANPAVPDRSASAPNGYPVQSPAAAPAANPYGSFVVTPQPGYTDATTGHLDGSQYGYGYGGPGQSAAPDAGWYSAGTGNGTSYYDPSYNSTGNHAAGQGHTDTGGTGASDLGYTSNGYAGADYHGGYGDGAYQGGDYPAAFPAPGYTGDAFQGSQPDPASYPPNGQFAGRYDQHSIAGPDLAYGHDGYQGYPGYGGSGR